MARISKRGYYAEKISFFINVLSKYKNGNITILDIGCNDGELTEKYSNYGKVLGIDINEKGILECKRKGLECKKMDVMDLDKKYHNNFDVVIAGDIIEHVLDTDKFLLNCRDFLKKGGLLLLTTPNVASLGRRIMLIFGKNPFLEYSLNLPYKDFNVGHIRYYTRGNLEEQLTNCGFKNIHIKGDKINILDWLVIPNIIAQFLPNVSRNLMVICEK
jgi:2-polyprenyl-3-methyl-5-hydroxy-6-metoxy-1,4-benzoquinol methylase